MSKWKNIVYLFSQWSSLRPHLFILKSGAPKQWQWYQSNKTDPIHCARWSMQLLTRCPGKRSARRVGPRSARGRSSTSTNKRTRIQCCADTGLLLDQRQESNVRKEKRVGRNSWLFLKLKMLIMNIHFKDLSLLTLMHFSLFLVLVCLCCFEWQWGLGWWF